VLIVCRTKVIRYERKQGLSKTQLYTYL